MSKNKIVKFDPTVPAKFADLFGPPAVLTAEAQQMHGRILSGLFHNVRPQDFLEHMFIDDLAYNLCRRQELRRLREKVICYANNEKFERLKRELLADAERRKEELGKSTELDKILESWRDDSRARERQPNTKLAIEREKKEAETNKKLAEIDAETNKRLAELQKAKDDEAASFEQWIDAVERINKELAGVEQNIRITLRLLDEHRTGLGQRLRQAADEIVDVEFVEEAAPACEEAVGRAQSIGGVEVEKAATGPITVSSVPELPSVTPSPTNGGAPGPIGRAPEIRAAGRRTD